jgi:hypothetical protein
MPSRETIYALLGSMPEPYQTFCWLTLVTGMRVGEITALKWKEDYRFGGGTCTEEKLNPDWLPSRLDFLWLSCAHAKTYASPQHRWSWAESIDQSRTDPSFRNGSKTRTGEIEIG